MLPRGRDQLRIVRVPPVGFEPTTVGLKVHCANQAAPRRPDECIGRVNRCRSIDTFGCHHGHRGQQSQYCAVPRLAPVRVPILVLAVALSATACADLGDPYLGATPAATSTTLVQPGSESASGDADPGIAETPQAQALPARPDGYVPQLLVSAPAGPFLVDAVPDSDDSTGPGPEGITPGQAVTAQPLLDLSELPVEDVGDGGDAAGEEEPAGAVLAVDDLLRGFVLQENDGTVRWYPAEGNSGRVINELGGALFDVGYADATPEAIMLVAERIERVRLVDGDRFLLTQLGPAEDLLDLSTTGGLTVLVIGNADCGELRFLSRTGGVLNVGGPATPDCPVTRRPAFGTAALSPDGEAVAYTRIDYRPDGVERSTTLVAQELGSGDLLFEEIEVGSSGQVVESLAFDGERAALLRRTNAGSEVVLVEAGQLRVLELSDIETPRSVTFARLPVTNQAPISN